jgi:hypothetical protein
LVQHLQVAGHERQVPHEPKQPNAYICYLPSGEQIMKATHNYLYPKKCTRTPRGQSGFFTVALGLGLTALLGATSAVIVSTQEDKQEVAAISQQPVAAQAVKTASTGY